MLERRFEDLGTAFFRHSRAYTAEDASTLAALEALEPEEDLGIQTREAEVDPVEIDRLLAAASPATMTRVWDEFAAAPRTSSIWLRDADDLTPPTRRRFVKPTHTSWGGKPTRSGLFTSVEVAGVASMWPLYCRGRHSEFPPPWRIWRLAHDPGARRIIVDSAKTWCDLVGSFPRKRGDGALELDWLAASQLADVIEITPRAVVSIEGVSFDFAGEAISPTFWSAASEVWLAWAFQEGRTAALHEGAAFTFGTPHPRQ